jgi:type IV secretory pathway VirJ component
MLAGLCLLAIMALSAVWFGYRTSDPNAAPDKAEAEISYMFAPFGRVSVYRPAGEPRATALFLSGDGGWNGGMAGLSRELADDGILVAGVSTPDLMRALEQSPDKCINANYALIGLSSDLQHRERVRAYMQPVLIGYSAGATLAYASIAQWPAASYRAVFSLGFSNDTPGRKPWCHGPGFAAKRVTNPWPGWVFAPNRHIKVPWTVLQGGQDKVVDFDAAKRFVARVPGANFVGFPALTHDFSDHREWLPTLSRLIAPMLAAVPGAQADSALQDLPLTLLPASGKGGPADVMAVIYSGDGGWLGLDRDLGGQLAARGVPVVGLDSLSYFWTARTPGGAGRDLTRIIAAYSRRWNRPRILLIGYSFGADALPAIVNALPPDVRAQVESLSLLGLGQTADFQFHLSSWLDIASAQSQPTVPEVVRLKGMTIRCIRGDVETESACPAIPKEVATIITVPGGHHFDRNAALLADIILGDHPDKAAP